MKRSHEKEPTFDHVTSPSTIIVQSAPKEGQKASSFASRQDPFPTKELSDRVNIGLINQSINYLNVRDMRQQVIFTFDAGKPVRARREQGLRTIFSNRPSGTEGTTVPAYETIQSNKDSMEMMKKRPSATNSFCQEINYKKH